MKHTTYINPNREEEVMIYARKRTSKIDLLEAYIEGLDREILGYGRDGQILPLCPDEVHCFIVEDGKVYALTETGKWMIRQPLYAIEETAGPDFVRINQSCLGNIRKISCFNASIGGALMVTFKNGHRDYVSRRQLKIVKERMKMKL